MPRDEQDICVRDNLIVAQWLTSVVTCLHEHPEHIVCRVRTTLPNLRQKEIEHLFPHHLGFT